MTLGELRQATRYFKNVSSTELSEIIYHVFGYDTAQTTLYHDRSISVQQYQQIISYLHRVEQGEPLAYVLGYQFFWRHSFFVNPNVLIPRPDTEHLIAVVEKFFSSDQTFSALDLGTGSGCIAISLALMFPNAHFTASDKSLAALNIAKSNAIQLGCTNVYFKKQNWFEHEQKKYQLIVSNPPYIDPLDCHLNLLGDEPITALTAPDHGMQDLVQIITQAPYFLHSSGYLVVEHGYDQGSKVRTLFNQNGFSQVQTIQDFGHNDRVTIGQYFE